MSVSSINNVLCTIVLYTVREHKLSFQSLSAVTGTIPSQPTHRTLLSSRQSPVFSAKLRDVFEINVSCASHLPAALCFPLMIPTCSLLSFSLIFAYTNAFQNSLSTVFCFTSMSAIHNQCPPEPVPAEVLSAPLPAGLSHPEYLLPVLVYKILFQLV